MWPYEPRVSESWNERKRLMRFRRQKEHLRFSEEIKLIPRGLVTAMLLLLVIGDFVAVFLCGKDFPETWPIVWDVGKKTALVMVAAIGLGAWLVIAPVVFTAAYVYRDARRRGMNAGLWLFLVLVTLPAYIFTGFIIYFVCREPLPYHCPKCGLLVSARYNYCPGCQYVLHPTCSKCQREVGDTDRYCQHCGNDLTKSEVLERV